MVVKTVIVINKKGIHARPSKDIVVKASEFQSQIVIKRKDGPEIPANSILSVLIAGFVFGEKLFIVADGPDEEEASCAIKNILEATLY